MNLLREIQDRFRPVLSELVDDPSDVLEMIKPAQDARFGDYQANCAMPLGKKLGKPPRDVAAQLVDGIEIDDLCETPEIAGPGFINLRIRDDFLVKQLQLAVADSRLSIATTEAARTYIIDYSSPNVAKPMHVGHIRSTVIGDALCRILRFVGHTVISDNHLGDWGTQFGMIIYGYRHFANAEDYQQRPVEQLGRVYRIVRQIMDYHEAVAQKPIVQQRLNELNTRIADAEKETPADKAAEKKAAKTLKRLRGQAAEAQGELRSLERKIDAALADSELAERISQHANIQQDVLNETARLHEGDAENLELWREFLPKCREEIQQIYSRLNVSFDEELGESFYQDRLAGVVDDFLDRGLATESDGAICLFLDGFEAPMIIRKKDGAFLYATTDLATIQYRMQRWSPDAILYVVDFRQGEHFDKLFAAARLWGHDQVELKHIAFGTVLGEDGKPFKTREGDTVGLESLLNAAVQRAANVVAENDDAKPNGAELSEQQRSNIANVVGHAAIKYADLSQNRVSDYVYSEEKMVALRGNTATYLQYSYARVQSIFARGQVDVEALRSAGHAIKLEHEKERALAVQLLRFSEALEEVVADYRPNHLTNFLFELATNFSGFFESCPVLKADTDESRNSRLLLCDLVARTLRTGMALLGIETIEKM